MKIIQSYSTYPADDQKINNLDLLLLVISATLARSFTSNQVELYCNKSLKETIVSQGLASFWDKIDICEIEQFMEKNQFDPHLYFTASKCHILANTPPPFLYIDHDFFLFEKPQFLDEEFDLAFAHLESIEDFRQSFPPKAEYYFPKNYPIKDVNIADTDIINTSIVGIKNIHFQQSYKKLIDNFFVDNQPDNSKVYRTAQFNLPDQRFFTAAASEYKALNVLGKKFIKTKDGTVESEVVGKVYLKYYRHIWSMKDLLKESKLLRRKFLKQMLEDLTQFVDAEVISSIVATKVWIELNAKI